jgi:hypothetical protein
VETKTNPVNVSFQDVLSVKRKGISTRKKVLIIGGIVGAMGVLVAALTFAAIARNG